MTICRVKIALTVAHKTRSTPCLPRFAGGEARLRCAEVPGGCTCAPRTLDAHTREHASVRRVAYLKLGGAGLANCAVELTTLDRSSSGGFKWKLVRLSVGLALE